MKPLSYEDFADFCETMPPEEIYEYSKSEACACAQWAESMGRFDEWYCKWAEGDTPWGKVDRIAEIQPWTFGALAKRLRAAANNGK